MVDVKWVVDENENWYPGGDFNKDLIEAAENLLFRIRNIGYWNKPDTEMYIKALEDAVNRAKGEDNGND